MKCATKFCRGLITEAGHSPYCGKCRARRWREKHPVAYAYNKLKYRAKERGHQFTLTRERFAELWNGGLSANHGKTKFSLCVDRIRPREGYHDGNVRLITLSENSRLRFVPFFKDREQEQLAIAETERAVAEAYA